MPRYEARMRVIYNEVWSVEAESEDEAKRLFEELDDEVITDEVGEVIDWEIENHSIKKVKS